MKVSQWNRIGYKLVVPVFLIITISLTYVAYSGYTAQKEALNSLETSRSSGEINSLLAALDNAEETKELLRETMNQYTINLTKSVAEIIAVYPEIKTAENMTKLAEKIGVEEIHYINDEGILTHGSVPSFYGFDFATSDQTRPILKILDDPDYTLAQEPTLRGTDNTLFQYISVSTSGEKGIVQTGLSPQRLMDLQETSSLKETLKTFNRSNNKYIMATDRTGKILYHRNPAEIGKNINLEKWGQEILKSAETGVIHNREILYWGRDFFISYTLSRDTCLIAVSSREEFTNQLMSLKQKSIFSIFLTLIIGVLVLAFIIKTIVSQPLARASSHVVHISGNNDLTRQLDIRPKKSSDELNVLSHGFNLLVDNLRSIINGIKHSSDANLNIKHNLSANIEETAASISHINKTLTGIDEGIQKLKTMAGSSSSDVTSIFSHVNNLDERISNQMGSVEESTAAVTEMVASLHEVVKVINVKSQATRKLIHTAHSVSDEIEETKEVFSKGVAAKVDEIMAITQLISGIASQTNLLSMNAAIEAAHAGEQGKGFAVVAEEIRQLAEEAALNSSEISRTIQDVISSIDITSDKVTSTGTFVESIKEEIQSVDQVFYEMLKTVEEISLGGEQVLIAMEALNSASQDVQCHSVKIKESTGSIVNNIKDVAAVASESACSISEATAGTEQIDKAMKMALKLTSDLGDSARELSKKVNAFTT